MAVTYRDLRKEKEPITPAASCSSTARQGPAPDPVDLTVDDSDSDIDAEVSAILNEVEESSSD